MTRGSPTRRANKDEIALRAKLRASMTKEQYFQTLKETEEK